MPGLTGVSEERQFAKSPEGSTGEGPSLRDVAHVTDLLTPLSGPIDELAMGLIGGGGTKADPKSKKPKTSAAEQAAAKSAAEQKAIEEQIQAVQNSPWTKLSNALVSEYQQEQTPVAALVSGAGIPGAQNAAAAGALGSLGLSPGSSAGQWLSAQTGAAQAQTAPIAQAMAQEGAQYQAEMGPISKAIQAYGEANALSDITAPEQAWLSALSSHITSNLSYQGVVPTASLPSLSPAVVEALKLSGGYGGSAGAGTTPLQNVGAAPGGGSKPLTTTGVSPGQINTGIVPKASPAPA